MKKIHYLFLTASALSVMFGVASCGETPSSPQADFDFSVAFESGRNTIYLNEYEETHIPEHIVINPINQVPGVNYNYTYTVIGSGKNYATVNQQGYVTPLKLTDNTVKQVRIEVLENVTETPRNLIFKIINKSPAANEGANYSSDKDARNEILGELESFAMNNFLTGITLFENGGWVRYSDRVRLGTEDYIAGYGFGLLAEGSLDPSKPLSGVTDAWPTYLRSATSSETYSINAWDTEGSQISDLNGYITSGYWSTRMGADGKSYEWFPCLAADKVVRYNLEEGGSSLVNNDRPVPVDNSGNLITKATKNEKGLYRRWRVYVKTSEVQYRTMAAGSPYEKRAIELEDYVTPFKLLLTQSCGTFRGGELASDTSYGIKGGFTYYRNTETATSAKADEAFNHATGYDEETGTRSGGELGITTGFDDELGNGAYIEFELINPIDDFTAMYTLSSNLYSPLPNSYVSSLYGTADKWIDGAKAYGKYGNKPSGISDTEWFQQNTLCVGPFFLERWDTTSQIIFKLNEDWFEHNLATNSRYHIDGVHISIESAAQKNPDTVWNLFNSRKLDSAGIPKSYLEGHAIPETGFNDYQTRGDSTFKLNVNSCDQEMSDYLFGPEGKIEKHNPGRTVKPWMANNNFLRGLFWSIKRKDFARDRGVNPSYEYFADAYLTEIYNQAEEEYKSVSYNTTGAHNKALTSFLGFDPTSSAYKDKDMAKYGYDKTLAVNFFKTAVSELLKKGKDGGIESLGSKENPYPITIDIWWMYQSDIEEYGKDIKNYFEETFNDNSVANGQIRLTVNNEYVTNWEDVYKKHLMTGEFDLGFGAISGNTLNPLNFLEVLRSDNSSKFTLNWGTDTGKISDKYPITYDGKEWTFDSLWAAADHGVVAKDGEEVKPVKSGYMKSAKKLDNPTEVIPGGDLTEGCILDIDFSFVEVESSVDFDITKVQVYLPGTDNLVITVDDVEHLTIVKEGGKVVGIQIKIEKEVAEDINKRLFDANDLQDAYDHETDEEKKKDILKPFKSSKYDIYWSVEVYYDLKIEGAMPVENVYYIAPSESDIERSFARL